MTDWFSGKTNGLSVEAFNSRVTRYSTCHKGFLEGAQNLRRATHGIRILDLHARLDRFGVRAPLVFVDFPLISRMGAQMRGDPLRHGVLAPKTAGLVHLFAKHFRRSKQGLEQAGR